MSRIQATRAAAFLKKELGIDTVLVEGHYGELSVEVDDEEVIDGGALEPPRQSHGGTEWANSV